VIESLAVKRNISFYDTSYVQLAESIDLNPVTEDEELLKSCKKAISLRKFLGMEQG
jgi:predicted nucleic acid-binding protein